MTPIRCETEFQANPSPSPDSLFGREVVVGPSTADPGMTEMTRRNFNKLALTCAAGFAFAPFMPKPNLPATTLTTADQQKSNLLIDRLLGHYLESGNLDDLRQFIPEAEHQTEDELSLFLSPYIPFEVWTGVNSTDYTDTAFIMQDAFTKASAISSVAQARGYPLGLLDKLLGKAEKSGELKKLSNHMFGVGTNYDDKWYLSEEAKLDQKAANRITNGYITVDRLLFDDQGNLIFVGRKRMEPLVVKKTVKKFIFWDDQKLDINDQASDQVKDESRLPEITFAVKVNIKHLPFDVWGGKYDDSQSLLDCQAALTGNWLERMRQTPNLLLQREIVAWPRGKRDIFWDTQHFGGVNLSNKISSAVKEEPDAQWHITGHPAETVNYNPEVYDFDNLTIEDTRSRTFILGSTVKIPIGAKLYLHGLQRRTNGEFIALVEAKDETYAPANLPEPLYSFVFDFRNRYRGKFFWVSYQDLQSPAVRIKQK